MKQSWGSTAEKTEKAAAAPFSSSSTRMTSFEELEKLVEGRNALLVRKDCYPLKEHYKWVCSGEIRADNSYLDIPTRERWDIMDEKRRVACLRRIQCHTSSAIENDLDILEECLKTNPSDPLINRIRDSLDRFEKEIDNIKPDQIIDEIFSRHNSKCNHILTEEDVAAFSARISKLKGSLPRKEIPAAQKMALPTELPRDSLQESGVINASPLNPTVNTPRQSSTQSENDEVETIPDNGIPTDAASVLSTSGQDSSVKRNPSSLGSQEQLHPTPQTEQTKKEEAKQKAQNARFLEAFQKEHALREKLERCKLSMDRSKTELQNRIVEISPQLEEINQQILSKTASSDQIGKSIGALVNVHKQKFWIVGGWERAALAFIETRSMLEKAKKERISLDPEGPPRNGPQAFVLPYGKALLS